MTVGKVVTLGLRIDERLVVLGASLSGRSSRSSSTVWEGTLGSRLNMTITATTPSTKANVHKTPNTIKNLPTRRRKPPELPEDPFAMWGMLPRPSQTAKARVVEGGIYVSFAVSTRAKLRIDHPMCTAGRLRSQPRLAN